MRRRAETGARRPRPWRNPLRRAGLQRRSRLLRVFAVLAGGLLGAVSMGAAVARFDPAATESRTLPAPAPPPASVRVAPVGAEPRALVSSPDLIVPPPATVLPARLWASQTRRGGGLPPPAAPAWSLHDRDRIEDVPPPSAVGRGGEVEFAVLDARPGPSPRAMDDLLAIRLLRPAPSVDPLPDRPLIAAPPRPSPGPLEPEAEMLALALPPAVGRMAVRPRALPSAPREPDASPVLRTRPPPPRSDGRGQIALIIDDVGVRRDMIAPLIALPPEVTLSILPYARGPDAIARRARQRGHEVMLHLPMEPVAHDSNPGPRALLAGMSPRDLRESMVWNLERFDGFIGVNNHMGSRFTRSEGKMRLLMALLHERDLFFLDSLTTIDSRGRSAARALAVPFLARDIFIDNQREPASIARQLDRVVSLARREGRAIAIGHPYRETVKVLQDWLPGLSAKGVDLVPISRLLPAEPRS